MLRKVSQFQRGFSNISRKERLDDSKRSVSSTISHWEPQNCANRFASPTMFHEYNKFWPVRDRMSVRYSYQHDVTYQKTVLFTVTATTSNVTNIISFNIYQNDTTIKCKSLSQYKYFIPRKCCFIRQIPFLTRKIGLRDYHAICVCVWGGGREGGGPVFLTHFIH